MQDTDPAPSSRQAPSLVDWLRLERTPGVGPVAVQRLLQRFDHPPAIFSADHDALLACVSGTVARALRAPLDQRTMAYIDQVQAWLALPGNHVLTLDDPDYPPLLRHIPDPPVLLYVKGRIDLLGAPAVAIVGSRNASVQGVSNAGAFGCALSTSGLTIVSGLALGIDAAAHEGGLRGPGSTVAVVGTGIDRIYPRANEDLARRIAAQGCLVSEYSLGTRPLPENFPRRNRLISGLSSAVLVVEAAASSGSLITARIANDQGRDVFALPGSIHAPLAKGCHKLIKQGAKLVETAADLLDELRLTPQAALGPAAAPDYCGEYQALLLALGHGPVGADALAARCDLAPGLLAGQLLALELAGHVERLPGGMFQRLDGATGLCRSELN
ncbi:MAG: DNA-processing protein DprA [Pseudomonadota bacterium]